MKLEKGRHNTAVERSPRYVVMYKEGKHKNE